MSILALRFLSGNKGDESGLPHCCVGALASSSLSNRGPPLPTAFQNTWLAKQAAPSKLPSELAALAQIGATHSVELTWSSPLAKARMPQCLGSQEVPL